MSLVLSSYPALSESGVIKNAFAGFNPVEVIFDRQDIQIISVTSGVDAKALISVAGDITGSLNVSEWVYLHAVGASFIYDYSGEIITLAYNAPNTEITINNPYIENAASGYVNYKQNYFVEGKLVDIDNNAILKYPQLLSDNGTAAGVVTLDVAPPVDFLNNNIADVSEEIPNSRVRFKVMYREVWREDDTQAFILIDQTPIVIIHAADQPAQERFVNNFEIPKLWAGYPFVLTLLHTLENSIDSRFSVLFDELDINKENINIDNPLVDFGSVDFGFLQMNMNDNIKTIEDNTRFLRFRIETSELADYQTGDYNDTDYETINTP